jgi:hypothetical protein
MQNLSASTRAAEKDYRPLQIFTHEKRKINKGIPLSKTAQKGVPHPPLFIFNLTRNFAYIFNLCKINTFQRSPRRGKNDLQIAALLREFFWRPRLRSPHRE